MLTHIVSAGDIVAMNSITRTDRSVKASLAVSNRSASKSARTNDFTSRTPATFSCRIVVEPIEFLLHRSEQRLHLDDEEHDQDRGDDQEG